MTKSPRKLVLHKQTLRTLTSMELRRAIAGDGSNNLLDNTRDKQCPGVAIIATPPG
jgi:hypothetical protein